MNFGIPIDDLYDPNKDYIYDIICNYFDNPIMHKIKDINNYSVYMAKIRTGLSIDNRYLMAFVDKDTNPVDFTYRLNEIFWVSFQCRQIRDLHNIPFHTYSQKKSAPYTSILNLSERKDTSNVYESDDLNIIVTILNTSGNMYQYSPKGTLNNALETWNTIITFK